MSVPTIALKEMDVAWIVRVLPSPVVELLKMNPNNLVLAGGFIRSCVLGEKPNDVDLFYVSPEGAKLLALAYAGSEKIVETENAYTIPSRRDARISVQFIHRWTFSNYVQILSSFDFTIACACIWWNGNQFQGACHQNFYADLAAKRLVYLSSVREEEAGGSMLRVLKFYTRGFKIPLDSLGAVISRMSIAAQKEYPITAENYTPATPEVVYSKIFTNLLREVDPLVDPHGTSHFPALSN